MSYLEIKAIKAVAALHRGVVNTSIRTLSLRERLARKRYDTRNAYAADLERLAAVTASKAEETRELAAHEFGKEQLQINAAVNTVLNLQDDLNKIS